MLDLMSETEGSPRNDERRPNEWPRIQQDAALTDKQSPNLALQCKLKTI